MDGPESVSLAFRVPAGFVTHNAGRSAQPLASRAPHTRGPVALLRRGYEKFLLHNGESSRIHVFSETKEIMLTQ